MFRTFQYYLLKSYLSSSFEPKIELEREPIPKPNRNLEHLLIGNPLLRLENNVLNMRHIDTSLNNVR